MINFIKFMKCLWKYNTISEIVFVPKPVIFKVPGTIIKPERIKLSAKEKAYNHFKNRVYQRYGYNISLESYDKIIGNIKNNKATFVEYRDSGGTLFKIKFNNVDMFVVYDEKVNLLLTVFKPQSDFYDKILKNPNLIQPIRRNKCKAKQVGRI